jgi:exo-1,4-beta-D-glucosaminidase
VASDVLRPRIPSSRSAATDFVELLLSQGGTVVDRNVYWLPTRGDVVDWKRTIGQPQAYMKRYGDLRQLHALAPASISVSASTHAAAAGLGGADTVTDVTITNTSSTPTAAFFLRADVRRGNAAGAPARGDNEVLPVFWSADDITLWPGESETLHASYRRSALRGAHPVVTVSGWNVPVRSLPAG